MRIRDFICEDPVALKKWGVIADHLLTAEVDVIRIKDMLDKNKHPEAVLETLQLNCDLTGLLQALHAQGLNSLAGREKFCKMGTLPSHFWFIRSESRGGAVGVHSCHRSRLAWSW